MDFALNNLQWLIRHKTKLNHLYLIDMYKQDLALNDILWLICQKPNQTKFFVRLMGEKSKYLVNE